MSIYFPSGKYKLSIRSFLEYCHTIFGEQYLVCPPQEDVCVWWYKHAQIFFSPELHNNLYQALKLYSNLFHL